MSVPRLVCDTNIIISGLLWHGAPRRVLTCVQSGEATLSTCTPLLEELVHVLQYNKLTTVLMRAEVTPHEIVAWLLTHSTVVRVSPLPSPVITADPTDEIVLACAQAARADAIVSGDRHLLHLRRYGTIPIMSARAWLNMQGWK